MKTVVSEQKMRVVYRQGSTLMHADFEVGAPTCLRFEIEDGALRIIADDDIDEITMGLFAPGAWIMMNRV